MNTNHLNTSVTRPLCLVESHTLDASKARALLYLPHSHSVKSLAVAYWDWTRIVKYLTSTWENKMASICPVLKWLGCPVFKWYSNTWPFGIQPLFDHLNTKLVQYSDPYCSFFRTNYLMMFESFVKDRIAPSFQWQTRALVPLLQLLLFRWGKGRPERKVFHVRDHS